MKPVLFILLTALAFTCGAQTRLRKTETLNFKEVWVWEYLDSEGKKQDMAIYHHPGKNYWLFTAEAYGLSGEMTEWVLAKPDGEYIQRYRDEHGATITLRDTLYFNTPAQLPRHYQSMGRMRNFGDKKFGFPEFRGIAFEVKYEKTTDQSLCYLVKVKKVMSPLYYFNQLNKEPRLPVIFPKDLPADHLVLSEEIQTGGKVIRYRFRFISPTEYYIEI